MKSIILTSLLGVFALGAGAATSTPTLSELRQMEKEGKVRKMSRTIKTHQGKNFNQLPTTEGKSCRLTPKTENPLRSPMRNGAEVTEKGANLYGYLSYSPISEPAGMYEFTPDGYELLWADPMIALGGPQAMEGWYIDGYYWGISYTNMWGYMVNYDEFVIDFKEGELLYYESHLFGSSVMFVNVALDTNSQKVYGFAFDYDRGGELFWASADLGYLGDAESIVPADDFYCYALAFNPDDGFFYGVTDEQKFIRITPEGNFTVIADLSSYGFDQFITGMVYSQAAEAFYWAPYYENEDSALALINTKGNIAFIQEYEMGPNFTALITTDQIEVNPNQPGRPEIRDVNFEDGALTGDVEFSLPLYLANGEDLPKDAVLSYVALLDNDLYAFGSGKPGEDLTINYTVKEKGYHTFGLYASYNRIQGYTVDSKIWVGNDTPFAPANITLTKTEASWKAVSSTGIHGGYVNPAEVTYNVYLDGKLVGSTKETTLALTLPEDKPFSAYSVTVTAEFDGSESAAGRSNYVGSGQALSLPLFMQPTAEEFRLFTIIDGNNDGVEWGYSSTNRGITIQPSAPGVKVDDYAFLPPVEITDTEHFVRISFEAARWKIVNFSEDYLELVWATEPSMDKIGGVILPEFTPLSAQFRLEETLWMAPQPGTYYIGVRCSSEGDRNGALARAFNVEMSGVTTDSPMAPEIVETVAGEKGALNAELTVKLPTETIAGNALDSDKEMTLYVTVEENRPVTFTGKPGEELNVTIGTIQGTNRIIAYVTYDELPSPSTRTSVYTGVWIPANPENFTMTVSPDMMNASLKWDAVTTSLEEGGYVDPAEITYTIYEGVSFGFDEWWDVYDMGVKGTSYEVHLPAGEAQGLYRYGVVSNNVAGSPDAVKTVAAEKMGTPYALPFVDNLDDPNAVFSTAPWLMVPNYNGVDYTALWAYDLLSSVTDIDEEDDRFILLSFTYRNNSMGLLSMPRISTRGLKGIYFTLKCLKGAELGNATVFAQIYGSDEMYEIGTIDTTDVTEPYEASYSFTLPEMFDDRDWVQLLIRTEFGQNYEVFVITGVEITDESGVEAISTENGVIYGGVNAVNVLGHEGDLVTVSTLDGLQVARTVADSNRVALTLGKGVYVVTAGDQRAKVIVR